MKKIKQKKRMAAVISAMIVFILIAADIAASYYLFTTTVVRDHVSAGRAQNMTGLDQAAYSDIMNELSLTLSDTKAGDVYITSFDGLSLYGQYFKSSIANDDVTRVAICFHGYTGHGGGNSSAAAMYFLNNGFDVLLPDSRSHGNSEGDHITFGCKDRFDGLSWVEYIRELYQSEDSDGSLEIYLYGVSMGGATVCMISGFELPSCVKGIISDCAFTSPEEIFFNVLKTQCHLPPAPILIPADMMCRAAAGYSFDECNASEEVKKASVPMLFIHGTADTFVPPEMCIEIYNNCVSRKDILIVEDAGHIEAYYKARGDYERKINEFFGLK